MCRVLFKIIFQIALGFGVVELFCRVVQTFDSLSNTTVLIQCL